MSMPTKTDNKDKTAEGSSKSVAVHVADKIRLLVPDLQKGLVDALVQQEKEKRAKILAQLYDIICKLENDLKKLKPDLIALDADGKEVSANWSKTKFEEKKKLIEKIEKHERAFLKAYETGDYGDAKNLASGKDTGGSGEAGEGGAS